tara:strand:- start:208 stop:435 length:228 start_codon:yes stop_codon:yes gene_type:complete
MTKKEVQKYLSNYKDDEELFVMWWDKEFFDFDISITDKEWKEILGRPIEISQLDHVIYRIMEEEVDDYKYGNREK